MMIIQTFSHSEVVVIRFPFSNLSEQKMRPALIVSPDSYSKMFNEVLVMQITSKSSEYRPQYAIQRWKESGLKAPSYVRYANLHHIHISHVAGTIGKLEKDEYRQVLVLLENFVSLN